MFGIKFIYRMEVMRVHGVELLVQYSLPFDKYFNTYNRLPTYQSPRVIISTFKCSSL